MDERRWMRVSEEKVFSTPYFSISENRFSDSEKFQDDFYRFNFSDWVNIVPETDSGDFIMVRIFRFGIEDYSLEFPGGQVEEGSSPIEAAVDELREETGYVADTLDSAGWIHPNPALQGNRCFFYHAKGLRDLEKQQLEAAEDISVVIVPGRELQELISRGRITHSLSVLAYYYSRNRNGGL
jgi:ADP-ribose pyrophosphatase